MNAIIANILKSKLSEIEFVDKKAGLVHTAEKPEPTDVEGAFMVRKFPISNDVDYEECFNSGAFKDLIPNSKSKGILYFEDQGSVPIEGRTGSQNYRSKLRLVCWINNRMIQGNNSEPIAHLLINQIRQSLEIGYFNENNISRIRVSSTNIVSNDLKLFSKYTYPSESLKYLMFPYEAFGIDLSVEFSIGQSCLPDMVISSANCNS